MVPYDQPLAAHDMLLRFIGVNLLGAAGPAAQVPSKIGDEQEAVLGETHPNGTAVTGTSGAVLVGDVSDSKSTTGTTKGSGSSGDPFEALANVGSALIILAIMGVGLVLFFFVRRRLRWRKGSSGAHHSRSGSLGRGQAVPQDSDDHELEELVDEQEDDDFEDELDREDRFSSAEKGKRVRIRDEAEIFGLGEGSEDENDDGGRDDDRRRHGRGID